MTIKWCYSLDNSNPSNNTKESASKPSFHSAPLKAQSSLPFPTANYRSGISPKLRKVSHNTSIHDYLYNIKLRRWVQSSRNAVPIPKPSRILPKSSNLHELPCNAKNSTHSSSQTPKRAVKASSTNDSNSYQITTTVSWALARQLKKSRADNCSC